MLLNILGMVETHNLMANRTVIQSQKGLRIIWARFYHRPHENQPFRTIAQFMLIDAIPKEDSQDLQIILNLPHPFDEGSANQAFSKDWYLGEEWN